jgi:hypothetical protein
MPRRFPASVSALTGFHLPLDEAMPAAARARRLFVALPNEEAFDAQQPARDTDTIAAKPAIKITDSHFTSTPKTDPPSIIPSYILQSVLNL